MLDLVGSKQQVTDSVKAALQGEWSAPVQCLDLTEMCQFGHPFSSQNSWELMDVSDGQPTTFSIAIDPWPYMNQQQTKMSPGLGDLATTRGRLSGSDSSGYFTIFAFQK